MRRVFVAEITLDAVGKVYGGETRAISDLSIRVADGEFVVLVGPSGCGKSTVLRMVAGLEEITEGKISIGDRVVNDMDPKDRDISMGFQNYALYPHMTVRENMGFGLKLRNTPKDEITSRVKETARVLEITDLLDRKPRALSGGQRQRVAMGRAIVREPAAFLMDEPLSNLDAKLRVQMRAELGLLHARLGTTTLYVAHAQLEAMTMGDRVAVLKTISSTETNLQQIAGPRDLYENPVNLFVAGFIGSPSMNFFYARVSADGTSTSLSFAGSSIPVDGSTLPKGVAEQAGQELIVGVRPEAFEIRSTGGPGGFSITVQANLVEQLGPEAYLHFTLPMAPVVTADIEALLADEGASAESLGSETKFIARVNPDHTSSMGSSVDLVIDPSKLHFFDKATGLAL